MTKATGIGRGGYKVKSTDAAIGAAIAEEISEFGYYITAHIEDKCFCNRRKVKTIAERMGVLEFCASRPQENTKKPHELYDHFVRMCQEAAKENDLDNELGHLLSLMTGISLDSLKRLAAGERVNVESLPRVGVVYRRYCPEQPLSWDVL